MISHLLTIMFEWLRDVLVDSPSSLTYSQSIKLQSKTRQDQMSPLKDRPRFNKHRMSSHDETDLNDDHNIENEEQRRQEEEDARLIERSFYHNPYQCRSDVDCLQLDQETFEYRRQSPRPRSSQPMESSIDDEIQSKLVSLKARSSIYESVDRRHENEFNSSTQQSSQPFELGPSFHWSDDDRQSRSTDDLDLTSVVVWYKTMISSLKKYL